MNFQRALAVAWMTAVCSSAAAQAIPTPTDQELNEVVISVPEPRYVAPTRRDRIGRIWAPVYLNRKGPFRLVLDTGATRSAVIGKVVEALGDDVRTESEVRLRGATGTAMVPLIRISEMEIGDLVLAPVKMPVVLDVFGGADGVLGNEGLRDKRVVIDFRHDSISIKRSRRERPGSDYNTVPVTLGRGDLLMIDALVGHVPVKAIIDTGAPNSLGNLALLQALRQPTTDDDTEIVGVTLDIEHGYQAHVPTIYFKKVRVQGAVISFGDIYIFQHWGMTREPTLMLGMDVLGLLDQLIIDYRTRELHIRTTEG